MTIMTITTMTKTMTITTMTKTMTITTMTMTTMTTTMKITTMGYNDNDHNNNDNSMTVEFLVGLSVVTVLVCLWCPEHQQ